MKMKDTWKDPETREPWGDQEWNQVKELIGYDQVKDVLDPKKTLAQLEQEWPATKALLAPHDLTNFEAEVHIRNRLLDILTMPSNNVAQPFKIEVADFVMSKLDPSWIRLPNGRPFVAAVLDAYDKNFNGARTIPDERLLRKLCQLCERAIDVVGIPNDYHDIFDSTNSPRLTAKLIQRLGTGPDRQPNLKHALYDKWERLGFSIYFKNERRFARVLESIKVLLDAGAPADEVGLSEMEMALQARSEYHLRAQRDKMDRLLQLLQRYGN